MPQCASRSALRIDSRSRMSMDDRDSRFFAADLARFFCNRLRRLQDPCPPRPHARRVAPPEAPSRVRFHLHRRRPGKSAGSVLFPAAGGESSLLPAPNTRCETLPMAAALHNSNALQTLPFSRPVQLEAERSVSPSPVRGRTERCRAFHHVHRVCIKLTGDSRLGFVLAETEHAQRQARARPSDSRRESSANRQPQMTHNISRSLGDIARAPNQADDENLRRRPSRPTAQTAAESSFE